MAELSLVGDSGGGDTGGGDSPAPSGGGDAPASSREPTQVIPKGLGSDGGDDGDDVAADGSPAKPRVPKPTKHKLKFYGQEREVSTLDEVLPFLSDDYEHEIPVSGEKRKAKYQDLVRGYQLSEGAFDRMRQAAEMVKGHAGKIDHGKKDPGWYLEAELGVEDHIRWAAQVVSNQMKLEKELDELYNTDRFEWQRRMDKLAADRVARKDALATAQKQAAEQDKARREGAQRREGEVKQAVEALGLPWNSITRTIALEQYTKYAQVGHQLAPADVAAYAQQEYLKQITAHFGKLDEEGMIKLLGDDWRKRLRKYELQQVQKGGKQPATPAATPPARKPEREDGISEGEYLRRMRARG